MFERILYRILKESVEALRTRPARLTQFMSFQRGLSAAESSALRTKFLATPPVVQHGYASKEAKFPVFCVILDDDRPIQKFLGDRGTHFMGLPLDAEVSFGEKALDVGSYSCYSRQQYHVLVAAEGNPDYCIFLYEVAKFAIASSSNLLKEAGVLSWDWSGGQMSPVSTYEPHYVFERQLTISFETEYIAPIYTDVQLIEDVVGLTVDTGEPGTDNHLTPDPYIADVKVGET